MKFYDKVPIKDCIAKTGKQPIATRWIDVNKQDAAITGEDAEAHINTMQMTTSFGTMMEKLNVAASRAIVNWMVLPMHYKGFAIGEFTSHIYLAGFTGKLWVITDNKKVNAAVHEILTVCLPELVWLNPDIPKQWWEGRKGIEEARRKYSHLKHYV